MVGFCWRQLKSGEDIADVLLHRAVAHPQRRGDARVRASLGPSRSTSSSRGEGGHFAAMEKPGLLVADIRRLRNGLR
jgi:hypothetical protein